MRGIVDRPWEDFDGFEPHIGELYQVELHSESSSLSIMASAILEYDVDKGEEEWKFSPPLPEDIPDLKIRYIRLYF